MYTALFGLLTVALFAHWTKQWLRDNPVLSTGYRLDEMSWRAPVPYRSVNDHQVFATTATSAYAVISASAHYPLEWRR